MGVAGTLAHRDVRARAYRDVFTAFPATPIDGAAGTVDSVVIYRVVICRIVKEAAWSTATSGVLV